MVLLVYILARKRLSVNKKRAPRERALFLFLRFLMLGVLAAPLAVLARFDFFLNLTNIFMRVVVVALANGAAESD